MPKDITFYGVSKAMKSRPSKYSINLLNKFMDTWYAIYPRDYDRTFNATNGNQRAMINNIAKRKGTQQRIINWMNTKTKLPHSKVENWLEN